MQNQKNNAIMIIAGLESISNDIWVMKQALGCMIIKYDSERAIVAAMDSIAASIIENAERLIEIAKRNTHND